MFDPSIFKGRIVKINNVKKGKKMIENLIEEILEKIKDNKNKNNYKYLVLKETNMINFLIYKNENYLKHPFIQLLFTFDSCLHIDVEFFIEPKNKKIQKYGCSTNFVLLVNQYHPDSMYVSKENNEIEIADFIDCVKKSL